MIQGDRFDVNPDHLRRGTLVALTVLTLAIASPVAGESDTNVATNTGSNSNGLRLRAAGVVLKWLED